MEETFKVRCAVEKDIPGILQLLVQVDMVHHNGRPDIFKGPATKYNAEELKCIILDDSTPVFVCEDPLGKVVWTCNPGAMKFYEKMGLKPLKICMETIL